MNNNMESKLICSHYYHESVLHIDMRDKILVTVKQVTLTDLTLHPALQSVLVKAMVTANAFRIGYFLILSMQLQQVKMLNKIQVNLR